MTATATPPTAAPSLPAVPAPAPAVASKIKIPREQDPRNPNFRLRNLLDPGSVELITPDDDSGMLAAIGTINGCRVVAFCSDPTVMGGAMGMDGCDVVVRAWSAIPSTRAQRRRWVPDAGSPKTRLGILWGG